MPVTASVRDSAGSTMRRKPGSSTCGARPHNASAMAEGWALRPQRPWRWTRRQGVTALPPLREMDARPQYGANAASVAIRGEYLPGGSARLSAAGRASGR
jgi:hypothetical protein